MKYLISILLIFILINCVEAQNNDFRTVSELKGDSLQVYNLLKKSIKLSSTDSTRIHFLPMINIFVKEERLYFETYFYDKDIRNSWNYATATNLGQLSLEKRHLLPERENLNGYDIVESTESTELEPKSISSTFKFSVKLKNRVLLVEESQKPILNESNSYYIKAVFYKKVYKNIVDKSIYNFINEDSIGENNYYFLSTKEYAILKIKDKYGFINNENDIIMPFNKNKITYYEQGFLVQEDSIQYFYDPIKEKKVTKDYDKIFINRIRFYNEGGLSIKYGYHLVERNNSYNLLNNLNEEMLSNNYKSINGLGHNKKKQYILFVKKNDGGFNLIDLYTQDIIRSGEFMQIAGGLIVTKENNKYGIVNTDNDIILKNKYDEIIVQNDNIARLPIKLKNKWALFVTHKHKFVTEFKYSSIIVAGEHMIVSENGKYGIINSDGKTKLLIEYDEIKYNSKKSIYTAIKGKTEEKYNIMLKKIE